MSGSPISGVTRFLRRITNPPSPERTTGRPTSSNRASSFHLRWEVPPRPLTRVAATLEILEPPRVDDLYFWALQVNFAGPGGARRGGAHLGLQHHSGHPGSGAVNWGGYGPDGRILDGSTSELPSAMNNANTRDYRWRARRPYRLVIEKAPDPANGWRGTVTDLADETTTVVRDLHVDADYLAGPMTWSEIFAPCDAPPVAVRWSDLETTTERGTVRVGTVSLNYQTVADGGCSNTSTEVADGEAFVQLSTTPRRYGTGTRLTIDL